MLASLLTNKQNELGVIVMLWNSHILLYQPVFYHLESTVFMSNGIRKESLYKRKVEINHVSFYRLHLEACGISKRGNYPSQFVLCYVSGVRGGFFFQCLPFPKQSQWAVSPL